jgi:DNA-binding transcriptional regulator GbsR (MarR family)
MNTLTPTAQRFVLHWGEMGTRWGINRTVAQIHALLMISPNPLPADVICERLGVARSNVSNSLRELQDWGVVRLVHVIGDRRDHFESLKDVWVMFRAIAQERKKREMDPTMAMLTECLAEADSTKDAVLKERLTDLQGFFVTVNGWYEQIFAMPTGVLKNAMKLGSALSSLLPKGKP